jgi:hypothetical protein
MFDTNNPGDAEGNFSALIEEKKDVEGATMFESIFSYNDSASFLAYDKSLDTDKVGNLYADSAARSEGVAYLAFTENGNQTVFADYQYSEITIVAQAQEEEEEVETPETDDHETDETNVAMLFSSIVIALVLVFAIASIVARKIIKNYRKTHGVKAKAPKAKKEKAVKVKKAVEEEKQDEDSPYND